MIEENKTLNSMKNRCMVLISVLLCFLFSACEKQKSCPGFNTKDMEEFTYLKPDTITFENETSGFFQIFISHINLSLPYTYKCKDLYKVCPCINYIEAQATDTKTPNLYSFLRMEQSDVSEMQYFKYNVQGFEFEFDFINELPYIDQMDHLKYYSSFIIGDVVYKDVIVITNLDLETANISQVFFNKQFGVLRFIEKSTNSVWSIKN